VSGSKGTAAVRAYVNQCAKYLVCANCRRCRSDGCIVHCDTRIRRLPRYLALACLGLQQNHSYSSFPTAIYGSAVLYCIKLCTVHGNALTTRNSLYAAPATCIQSDSGTSVSMRIS
jgi:hypothetical protein